MSEGLYVEYEKKDKLFVGGMVSERGGAKKLSFNFKNSNLTLTSTSRPNPFKAKTSHGQWTTEKKSVGKWRKNRNVVKRTMASLSYLP